jgi:VanZ family protein
MTLDRVWWALGAVIVVLAIIVCLVPGHELPGVFEYNDKVSHLVGHGLLALYFSGLVVRRSWWKIFIFLLLLGAAIEYAQYAMNVGREGDPRDVVANSIGALLGLVVGWFGGARWPLLGARIFGRGRAG